MNFMAIFLSQQFAPFHSENIRKLKSPLIHSGLTYSKYQYTKESYVHILTDSGKNPLPIKSSSLPSLKNLE